MSKFTYLFSAVDEAGTPHIFCADSAYSAGKGDLILHEGDIYTIQETCYCAKDSDEYALISNVSEIKEAETIFKPCWERKADTDESA